MRDRQTSEHEPSATGIPFAVVVAIVCAAIAVIRSYDPSIEALLDYRRAAIGEGSLHRLVTAHLVHLSTAHAVLDIAALALVAWIFAAELTARRLIVVTLASIASIDVGLWFAHPEVERYAGLSGVLHGWFAAGAVGWALADHRANAFAAKRAWGALLLGGLVVKLVLEQRGSAFWLQSDSMQVVTATHRWGAAVGLMCVGGYVLFRRRGASADGVS